MNKYHLVSLGCPKNRVDSELIMGVMARAGYVHTDNPEEARTIIINTCAFIEPATQESVNLILDYGSDKGDSILMVTGCLNRRYRDELPPLLPEVDHFVDPSEIEAIPDLIREEPPAAASEKSLFSGEYERTARVVSTPGYAFLRISDGCSRNCSYCAIPSIRGPLQSVDINDLVDEANYLAANSVKELVIVGQDITSYGRDKSDPQALEKLLEKLETIEALEWIRLMYLHPQGISKELIRMVSESSRILPYLDIPFQHVSGKVLKAMSRPWAPGQITRLIEDLRDAIPDLTLRTTVMVGFPGEGEDEFRELLDFVREYRIDRLGIFQYYPEEGTKAFNLGDPVPGEVKRDRINKLIEVQEQIARERGLKWTGRVTKALVEGVSPESEYLLQGRVWDQAPEVDGALYITDGRALAGNFHTVRVHDSHGPDLFGEIIR